MKIICIHQSADLYGSDRSFLQVIDYLNRSGKFEKLTVIIPREGPLVSELQKRGVIIKIMALSLLSRTYLRKFQFGKILFPLFRFRQKKKLLEQYDIIYVNTSVILDFYLLAPFLKRKKFIHIREIPGNLVKRLITFFILRSGATVIFNSQATRDCFRDVKKCRVVHNAFEGFRQNGLPVQALPFRLLPVSPLKILLIGRINSGKGQDFAIDALSRIKQRRFILRIVGDPFPGNENLLQALKDKISTEQMEGDIELIRFVDDPAKMYDWCDLVIVPSIKPESFGRIAIEAMSLGKPVLAAGHGGVCEIVQHEKSGFLFKPGDINDFNFFLEKYMDDRPLLKEHGKRSLDVFREKFSIQGFHSKLTEVFATN